MLKPTFNRETARSLYKTWQEIYMESAGLAFASLFSLVPLLSLIVALLQTILPKESVLRSCEAMIQQLMEPTFDIETQTRAFEIIQNALNAFYSWRGTWLSALSMIVLSVVGVGLLRRIQLSSHRLFGDEKLPLKTALLRLAQALGWVVFALSLVVLKSVLRHTLEPWTFRLISIPILIGQLVGIALFLRALSPRTPTIPVAASVTLIGYLGWKVLTTLLKTYAVFSVKSRTILGPWAIVPLFLMWIYAQYALLFLCLGLMNRWKTLRRQPQPYPPHSDQTKNSDFG